VDWDFGDGTPRSNGRSATHTYARTGWFAWSVQARQGRYRCQKTWLIAARLPSTAQDVGGGPAAVVEELAKGLKRDYRKERLGANLDASLRYPLRFQFEPGTVKSAGCRAETAVFVMGDPKALDQGLNPPASAALSTVAEKSLGLRLRSGAFVCRGSFSARGQRISFPQASAALTDTVRFAAGSLVTIDGSDYEYDGQQWVRAGANAAVGPGLASAVASLKDPALLADLSKNHSSAEVRTAVIGRMTDETQLYGIASSGPTGPERLAAIARINSQPLLLNLARTGRGPNEKLAAAERISDERLLTELVRGDVDAPIMLSALQRIESVPEIVRILKSAATTSVKSAAIGRLSGPALSQVDDPEALATIATEAASGEARRAAVARVENQDVLEKVARTDSELKVRVAALDRVSDPMRLATLAVAERDADTAMAAAGRITNEAALQKVAVDAQAPPIRMAAVNRVSSEERLADIAIASLDLAVGIAAVGRIKDPKLLERVALNVTRAPVWIAASPKLEPAPLSSLHSGASTVWAAPFAIDIESSLKTSDARGARRVQELLVRALGNHGWRFTSDSSAGAVEADRTDALLQAARKAKAQVLLQGTVTAYARQVGNTGTTVGFGIGAVDVMTGRVIYKSSTSRTARGDPEPGKYAEKVIGEFVKDMAVQLRKSAEAEAKARRSKSKSKPAPPVEPPPTVVVLPFAGEHQPQRGAAYSNAPAVVRDAFETALFQSGYRLAVSASPAAKGIDDAEARAAGRAAHADIVVVGTVTDFVRGWFSGPYTRVGFKVKAIEVATGAVLANFSVSKRAKWNYDTMVSGHALNVAREGVEMLQRGEGGGARPNEEK
jgi:hypothetical protein